MASALRRYAYAQARVRARLARLPSRAQLEPLAAVPTDVELERELLALGWLEPTAPVLAAFADVLDMLEGPPREVVARYRARYEVENLKVLLRAAERGTPYSAVAPLLMRVGTLAPGPDAEAVVEAGSLAGAVARLAPEPFGEALGRQVRSAPERGPERVRLEAIAERTVYESLWASVGMLEDAADRRSAADVLGAKLDVVNLVRALRMRTEERFAPEEVLAYAIRGGAHLGREARAVLAHEPVEAWATHLGGTPYAEALAATATPWVVERELARVLARVANRALCGSPFRIGLVLSYLVLLELAAADVRRLIEGKRLRRAETWILSGLVGRRAS
jgi:vacuolar-type H+-ATPase subunit C/Vma6